MSKGSDAADAIRRVSKTLEQFKSAIEILDEYGSFENASKEAKAEYEKNSSEALKAKEQMESLKKANAEALIAIAATKARLADDSKAATEDAKRAAEEIIATAKIEAGNILGAAQASMAADREAFNATFADLTVKKESLEGSIGEMTLIKNDLESRVLDLEKKLDKIRAQATKIIDEEMPQDR